MGSVTSSVATLTVPGGSEPATTATNGGAPSLWFYGALSLLAVVRKFFRKRG